MKKYNLGFIADAASGWETKDDGRRGILRLLNDPRRRPEGRSLHLPTGRPHIHAGAHPRGLAGRVLQDD